MQDKTSPRIRKLTQNSSFVQYDKNLLQSNSHPRNPEIPIAGYFASQTSLHIRTDCPPHNLPNKNRGGNRCSLRRRFLRLPWCAQGYNERQSEKMLSSFVVRFFRLPALRNTAASFVCPATLAPLHSAGAAPDERLRLQGQPLSWLLARSGLPWPPPYPLSGAS